MHLFCSNKLFFIPIHEISYYIDITKDNKAGDLVKRPHPNIGLDCIHRIKIFKRNCKHDGNR